MKVEVMLFAGLRELAGASLVGAEVPEDATFKDLRERLEREHPTLAPLLGFSRFSQDRDMVADSQRVRPDAQIALIPPVSGG